MSEQPFAAAPVIGLLAQTAPGGFALQNGTPVLLSWTAPNDGKQHRVAFVCQQFTTAAQTGGQVNISGTDPLGNTFSFGALAAGAGAGAHVNTNSWDLISPGTTVQLVQTTALTAGASIVCAELWGS